MGSAFSSTRKGGGSSSLLKVGRASKLVCVALLLFAAGAVATLHHADSSPPAWIPRNRKILRAEAAAAAAGRTRRSRHAMQRRRPASGRELLPRGLAHETTNLEMEASLAGDPERLMKQQQQEAAATAPAAPPPKRKSLLAVPVGIKNKDVVNRLVSKFPADDFAVMLFHYDGAVEQWGDFDWSERAVHVAAKGQSKWWFAKRFLHPDIVAAYDYVFIWDEDIEVDAFDPVRYLDVVRKEGLEVSQPALDRRSEIHHAITTRALLPTEDGVHRRVRDARCGDGDGAPPCVGWVEVMVPVFSRAAWRCAWGMVQNDLIHGWGLDYKVGYCAPGDRAVTVGVVDSEYVLHRGVPVLGGGGGNSAGRVAVRRRSSKEMRIFSRRWEQAAAEDKSWKDPYAPEPAREPSSG
ncbi:unnamed protein product [Urochloa decumbens]|uniref:Uncharacterized protein n=1 Tax=Urochloa decumbens TaxID=240449 RepID=A0ABC9FPQ7_9POAL